MFWEGSPPQILKVLKKRFSRAWLWPCSWEVVSSAQSCIPGLQDSNPEEAAGWSCESRGWERGEGTPRKLPIPSCGRRGVGKGRERERQREIWRLRLASKRGGHWEQKLT